MDNLTHTVIGALAGETLARFVPSMHARLPDTTRRSLYVTLMVVGGNLPDLDSLYTGITGGNLGYLLHHRGHTHTVVGALVISLLMFAVTSWCLRRRAIDMSKLDRWWLAGIALLAPLLHIAMDATNEYGVHPFWPLDNRWFYGDAIFIIEPLFWAAAAPLVFLLRRRAAKVLMALALVLGVALSFGSGLVPLPMALFLALLTVSLLLLAWRASERVAALAAVAATACVIVVFLSSAQTARREITMLAAAQYPDSQLIDVVLAPLPVNPLCWEVITMQLRNDDYTLRQALLSLAPGWLPAADCPGIGIDAPTTLALTPIAAARTARLQWLNEATMARSEARSLLQDNCEALAFAGFARAFWFRRNETGWLVGDLRYDREPGLGFAEMAVNAAPEQCPRFVPPWIPPRADLL